MIEFLKKVIVAIVQGIAEILPISSSGHILITSELLNIETSLQFAIFLHFGSLIAMIIYYWNDIKNILISLINYLFKKNREEETLYYCSLFIKLIIATIPAGILGVLLSSAIDSYFSNLYFVFSFLIITGILLLINKNLNGEKTLKELKYKESFCIGLFQGVGLFPGISRSGVTIFGSKVMRLSNDEAAHFSFLMFLPVTAGSFLLEIIKNFNSIDFNNTPTLITDISCIIIAGLTTFFSVKYLFKLIKKGKLYYFAYYCFAIAIIGIVVCLLTKYGF